MNALPMTCSTWLAGNFHDMANSMRTGTGPSDSKIPLVILIVLLSMATIAALLRIFYVRRQRFMAEHRTFFDITGTLGMGQGDVKTILAVAHYLGLANPLALLTQPSLWQDYLERGPASYRAAATAMYQRLFA